MNQPLESPSRITGSDLVPRRRRASREVEVTAPSRLHFGLLSFGHRQGRQFGGAGLMIERPGLRVRIAVARTMTGLACAPEPLADRIAQFARRWFSSQGLTHRGEGLNRLQITVESAPPQHVGLGSGTQLGLSIAAGLSALYGLPRPSPVELAMSVGRGLRSAVGTYGFAAGGLIVERGRLPGEAIGPLDCHLDLPERWRVVLIRPAAESGLSGDAEQQAFDKLPPVPRDVTNQLEQELRLRMVPAAARGEFAEFSESVFRYGRLAGMCFASIQGGPYNGPQLERLVERLRQLGVSGVGQSSWGPTLFALLPDKSAADRIESQLLADPDIGPLATLQTPISRHGVRIRSSGE